MATSLKESEKMKGRYSLKGTPSQGLSAATLGFFIGFAAVSLFGTTAHKFQNVMQLDHHVLVGLLVASPSLSGSLLRIPFSAWVWTQQEDGSLF